MIGPIACRDESCHGECGLKSIYYYGSDASNDTIPPDEAAQEFALLHGLNVEKVVASNRGERS